MPADWRWCSLAGEYTDAGCSGDLTAHQLLQYSLRAQYSPADGRCSWFLSLLIVYSYHPSLRTHTSSSCSSDIWTFDMLFPGFYSQPMSIPGRGLGITRTHDRGCRMIYVSSLWHTYRAVMTWTSRWNMTPVTPQLSSVFANAPSFSSHPSAHSIQSLEINQMLRESVQPTSPNLGYSRWQNKPHALH